MDVISHALMGAILCLLFRANRTAAFWIIFFSVFPDLTLIPAYIILGKKNKRFLWLAKNIDWPGFSKNHPALAMFYDITHSILFAAFIILPAVIFFKLPGASLIAYLFHIAIDVFSHKQEWAIKIFYPFDFKINGFSDAWAWPIKLMAISWAVLILIIFALKFLIS